jgi:hypothetical protein
LHRFELDGMVKLHSKLWRWFAEPRTERHQHGAW